MGDPCLGKDGAGYLLTFPNIFPNFPSQFDGMSLYS